MTRPRRYLPSISLLSAFEAVLRTGSTTSAARELQLSQGTVSRLIQNLESQLGTILFTRVRKRLVPTDAAHAYGNEISVALDRIQRASMRIAANLGGGSLSLAILPAFGTRWLAPRLGNFLAANPGISINLSTRLRPFDIAGEGFDAAVLFGDGEWPNLGKVKLFEERITACCAPSLFDQHPISSPADLVGLQLFRIETRPTAWDAWFEEQDTPPLAIPGMIFDQFAPMIEATIAGLGVALLPDYLSKSAIAEGKLRPLLKTSVRGTGSYWLTWPVSRQGYPPLRAFHDWILSESISGSPS